MSLSRAMRSDWKKTKNTPFRYTVILVPIIFPLLMLAYISSYNTDYTFQIRLYSIYFETIGISLPMIAGILTGINIMAEENAGEFRSLLTSPISRKSIYLSKLFVLILVTMIDLFVSTGILLLGIKIFYSQVEFQYGLFLEGTLFLWIGVLFLYCLYLIISIEFGIGPTIAISTGGTVLGTLLQTGLGDKIWGFIPWAWPGRLGTLPYIILKNIAKFQNQDFIQGYEQGLKELYVQDLSMGIPIAIISFLVITLLGVLWFEKWEGRKVSE